VTRDLDEILAGPKRSSSNEMKIVSSRLYPAEWASTGTEFDWKGLRESVGYALNGSGARHGLRCGGGGRSRTTRIESCNESLEVLRKAIAVDGVERLQQFRFSVAAVIDATVHGRVRIASVASHSVSRTALPSSRHGDVVIDDEDDRAEGLKKGARSLALSDYTIAGGLP
jgi:hypothetical protein